MTRYYLVEHMKTTFGFELESDSRFFKKIGIDITRGQFASDLKNNIKSNTTNSFIKKIKILINAQKVTPKTPK